MLRNISLALLFTLSVGLSLGAIGPFTSDAYAGVEQTGSSGELYAWTAGC